MSDNIIEFKPKTKEVQKDLSAGLLKELKHSCYMYLQKLGYVRYFDVSLQSVGPYLDNKSTSIVITFRLKE